MKKQLLIFSLMFLFLGIFFSGCSSSETAVSGDTDKARLVNIQVATESYSFSQEWVNFGEGFNPDDLPELLTNGSDYLNSRYIVSGTIRNVAGEMLNSTQVKAEFYDENDNLLIESYSDEISDLDVGLTEEIFITIQTQSNTGDFYNIHHVTLIVSASL